MKIERQRVGTVDVLRPTGALVEEDAQAFTQTLGERLRTGNPRLVVALQDVPYMDSQAIEGLLDATEALHAQGGSLRLAQVSPTCREILELTGVTENFFLFDDVPSAVKSFL